MTQELAIARPRGGSLVTQVRDASPTVDSSLGTIGTLTVLLGPFLSIVDFFIVNVALPSIEHSLDASSSMLELVVAGYGIAFALLLVLGGRLGDAFGRKQLFRNGMIAFGVASLLCGLAPSTSILVLARVAQGAAAAMMVPQALATIQAATVGHRRARAIGMYGATAGAAAVIGQLVGGLLISADIAGSGWRPIFLVNVPVVLVGLALTARFVPETRSSGSPRLDIPGTVLLGVTVFALLIPLTEGRAAGWPWWSWVLLAMAPVSAMAFVAIERRAEQTGGLPLVPLSLVRLTSMRNGLLIGMPFFAGFGGFMFVYAVALQKGTGASALEAGLALTPMGLAFLVSSLISPKLVTRFGGRVVGVGALVQAVGLAVIVMTMLSAWPNVTALHLVTGMTIAGAGQGLIMSPLFRVVLAKVPVERAGVGSGVLTTTQQVSLALGVATLGGLFLSLSEVSDIGMRNAFAIVVSVQAAIAIAVAVASRWLPTSVS